MSIIMRAMTSDDDQEILNCLQLLKKSSANTGFIHESVYHIKFKLKKKY